MCAFFAVNWFFHQSTTHPAQPVSVPVPPSETSSVVTNYEEEIHIANTAGSFGRAKNRNVIVYDVFVIHNIHELFNVDN